MKTERLSRETSASSAISRQEHLLPAIIWTGFHIKKGRFYKQALKTSASFARNTCLFKPKQAVPFGRTGGCSESPVPPRRYESIETIYFSRTLQSFSFYSYLCPTTGFYMGKRIKTYLLLAVSILMLAANVFPHHHHNEVFCLSADMETCVPPIHSSDDTGHHPGDADNHACDTTCITHFSFSAPHHQANCMPDYTYCILLHSLDIIPEKMEHLSSEEILYYIEKLHAKHFSAVRNFRAPPRMIG